MVLTRRIHTIDYGSRNTTVDEWKVHNGNVYHVFCSQVTVTVMMAGQRLRLLAFSFFKRV